MSAAMGLSSLRRSSLPFVPLPVGLSTLYSSHPTRIPEPPPVYLCISVSLRASTPTLLETQGRFSPSACWTAGGAGILPSPAFPSVSGTYLNVLDRTLPLPEPSGSPAASSLAADPTSPRGPESRCVYLCLPPPPAPPVLLSRRLVALLQASVAALLPSAAQGTGPGAGAGLVPLPLAGADPKVALIRARMWVPGLPLVDNWWHMSLAEDAGCGKSCQSSPSAQPSSSEVLDPGPAEFPRSMEKMLREGRKVAENDCLPNTQVLTSYFQHRPSWPWFSLFHWSVRGSGLLPPGLDPWQPPPPCCPQGPA